METSFLGQIIAAIISGTCTIINGIILYCSNKKKEKEPQDGPGPFRSILSLLGIISGIILVCMIIGSIIGYYSSTTPFLTPTHGDDFLSSQLGSLSWRLTGETFDASSIDAAFSDLQDKGFEPFEIRKVFSDRIDSGRIFDTLPEADDNGRVKKGEVILLVSAGKPHFHIESVVGMAADLARSNFHDNGCDCLFTWILCPSECDEQIVIWQYPHEGVLETEGTYHGYLIIGKKHDYIEVDESGAICISGYYRFASEEELLKWFEQSQ